MEIWYRIVSLLPFEWAQPGTMLFMKNALLGILVLCPLLVLGLGALIMRTGIAGAKMAVMVNLIASSTPAASATAVEENTPITVSPDRLERLRT